MSAPIADDIHLDELPPASPDDRDMALAFQRGEKGAYQDIYLRYEERVHRVCRRMLGKREDAQEAAQETFLRVYTALGRFNGRYQLGAWITRIATNVCLDQIRARSRHPVESTPIEELELDFVATGGDYDPETVSVRRAESRRVRKVLLGLPPLHRAAIVLRDFEGLSYAEVGVALGMTECQVKALIHRARKGFRRSWTPLAEMFVPAKLLHRLRDVDVSVKEHMVSAAASQSAPVASICGGFLQQCGSFVVQKVGPVVGTFVFGSVALASPGTSSTPVPAPRAVASVAQPDASASAALHDGREEKATSRPATSAPEPSAAPTSVPAAQPSPSATPAPTASAPPSASPPPAEGTAGTPQATPTPAPAPFLPELYYEQGQSPTPRAPVAHHTEVDCDTLTVSQTMTAEVSDHEGSYPIDLRLTTGSTFEVAFTVHKKGFAVNYTGGGVLINQSNTDNGFSLTFNGRYGSGGTAADSAGLPANGSIRVHLGLDCSAQSLIAESVVLATQ